MIYVVVDTNVLVSALLTAGSIPDRIVRLWQQDPIRFSLVLSESIVSEVEATLNRSYFSSRLSPSIRIGYLTLLRSRAIIVPLTVPVHDIATHPEDDLILATAVSGHVDYLVTGDKKLQQLQTYGGVTILSPRAFLEILETQTR